MCRRIAAVIRDTANWMLNGVGDEPWRTGMLIKCDADLIAKLRNR
ncbi:MAG: hypothetical protein ACJAYX_004170 [Planctomycetota bacterium]|jgi:hypothetical protein